MFLIFKVKVSSVPHVQMHVFIFKKWFLNILLSKSPERAQTGRNVRTVALNRFRRGGACVSSDRSERI